MSARHTTTPPSDDPAVTAEWQRLEAERLAEERAEARDDAEEAAHHPVAVPTKRRWAVPALLVALAAGIAATALVNRPKPESVAPSEQATDGNEDARDRDEANRSDAAALANGLARRIASTAAVSADDLLVRIGIRDQKGRDQFESILADSGLRIESGGTPTSEEAGGTPGEILVVWGRPADVDALVDRLVAPSAMLEVVSPALVAVASGPGEERPPTPDGAAGASPSEKSQAASRPERVTLRLEVLEIPAETLPVTTVPLEKSP